LKKGCKALATFEQRLPNRTALAPVFASCVFLTFSWTIVWFLWYGLGWLQFLNSWDVLGAFAYTQAFALLESTLILLLAVIVAIVLPADWFRDRFAAQGSMAVFVLTFWTLLYQFIAIGFQPWGLGQLLLALALPLISITIACTLVYRSERVETAICAVAERLKVFLYIYVPLGCLSLVIVIARNVL
jgi:hypothetical protein